MLKILSCVILFAKISVVIPQSSDITTCIEGFFACNNGKCILEDLKCDGRNDCNDLSDEADCGPIKCQEPEWFRCKHNKQCIHSFFVCDGENECADGSDEQNCSLHDARTASEPTCQQNQWQCTDKLCISLEWVCNGEADCLDGSDETVGCNQTINCDQDQFHCKNGQCILSGWFCDGNKDCKDGSDEENCETVIKPENCAVGIGMYLCEDKRTCLKVSEFCDGTKSCPNRTERIEKCSNNCGALNCSNGCVTVSSKTACWCPDGYDLLGGQYCVDINECETYGVCDQKCRNTDGSYRCFCDPNYVLESDGTTCKANQAEALLIYSTKTEIRGYYLDSDVYFPVAKDLKQAIGVAYDDRYVYWTEIFSGRESIVRSNQDGTHREAIVSSGLGTPEDLAIDWITGNIYFTDNEMQHIGVCASSGGYCAIVISHNVDKPRSIVLNPSDGEMYWTDWGNRPEIARSKMDGSDDISFVSNHIHWPNGLALDRPNYRIYWTDAKLTTLESIYLDGTDRRVIFEGIIKHPFGLAVFENRLYWSDWKTHSIESCDKFTGKNHHVLIKKKKDYIYGIHIYHPALEAYRTNPCKLSFCSDMCLLRGKGYTCACPTDKVLKSDKHTCRMNAKNQTLLVGTSSSLYTMRYQMLGIPNITKLPIGMYNITAIAYNSLNHTVFFSDARSHSIIKMDLYTGIVNHVIDNEDSGHITSMDFDKVGNNLYWCDSGRAVIEVLSLNTMSKKVLLNDMMGEVPLTLSLVPTEGYMFVAFQTLSHTAHIDRFRMDGTDRRHVHESSLLGPLHMTYDSELHTIFWTDAGTGNIQMTSVDGDDRHVIRSLEGAPVGISVLNKNLVWINRRSANVYWADKQNVNTVSVKNQTIPISHTDELIHLISLTSQENQNHPCQINNGNCSHICLVAGQSPACACPLGFKLLNDNETCFKPEHCELNEFYCQKSDLCISSELKCDGHKDCIFGEDETDCAVTNRCPYGYFQCRNQDCIKNELTCNKFYDCVDRSDEEDCTQTIGCPSNQFMCEDGECLENYLVCNGHGDCQDGSDERNCANSTCNLLQFRCASGSCIPKLWECDQEVDCTDSSDEHAHCDYATCKSPKFLCKNGVCIESNLKCNGINDCGDSSDETSCTYEKSSSGCLPHEFHCYQNSSICLPLQVRCNGTSECPKHEDEQGCLNCQMDEFECKNKRCIPTMWICDQTNDCGDNSDEDAQLCLHNFVGQPKGNACDKKFTCKNGQCIDMASVCNKMSDCDDGSDEDGACSTSCSINNNPCSFKCIPTPSGPQCSCGVGYKLRGDGHSCIDIQECLQEPPVCSQICYEKEGTYSCGCYDGYILRSDGKSCKSINGSMSLIFASSNKIYSLSQTNNTLEVLYSDESLKLSGLDVSVERRHLYFTTYNPKRLNKINLYDQEQQYIDIAGQPELPKVDWVSENVYFVKTYTPKRSIDVCNFNRRFCTVILDLNSYGGIVTALAVDATNKYLFFSTSSWQIFNSPNAAIYKCDLDGSNVQEVTKSNLNYISGLTYNPQQKLLFYANSHLEKMFKLKYDGTNPVAIINNLNSPNNLMIFEDQLYFYSSNGYLTICPLFDNYQNCKEFKVHGSFTHHFVVMQPSRQLKAQDTCRDNDCSNLCVRKDDGKRCLCESNAIDYKSEWCGSQKVESFKYNNGKVLVEGSTDKDEQSHTATIVILSLILIALIVASLYYLYRKNYTGNLNLSVRFHNSVNEQIVNDTDDILFVPGQHEYTNPMNFAGNSGKEKMSNVEVKLVF